MTDQQTLATDATDVSTNNNQAEAETKTYTQTEVDNMMARMKGSLSKKLLKPYEELGDPEELKTLKAQAEEKAQAEAIKRGEFEKTLQELAAKKDAEIQKRDSLITEYKVNTPIVDAAARYKAVAPDQVRNLLANSVRLGETGEVEVVGADGAVRYTDDGKALTVDNLVREFLDKNPHFVQATPATSNSNSNVLGKQVEKFDLNKLDLTSAEDRAKYAEAKKQGII